jgi:serine/threonine-protein phosphatase 2A regulatory subunit B
MYASSRGTIKLCDLRQSAICNQNRILEHKENIKSCFSEILSSISDIK